jgi:hypothetical protein
LRVTDVELPWVASIQEVEHPDPPAALRNYEVFYDMAQGTATLLQVQRSSAGVQGWAAATPATQAESQPDIEMIDATSDSARGSEPATVAVVVLQYSQSGEWFRRALMEGPELQEQRAKLNGAGFSPALPSGAKIFVDPQAFQAVVQHLEEEGWELKKSHVIVAKDFENKVRAVVEAARDATARREHGNCKVKSHTELSIPLSHEMTSETSTLPPACDMPAFILKRTFVHVPIPSSMWSSSSVHPATV